MAGPVIALTLCRASTFTQGECIFQRNESAKISAARCRFIFHAQPVGYWPITLHFGFHGCHHKFPMDKERLVFPPLPAFAVASVIYALLAAALPKVRDMKCLHPS